MIRKKQIFLSLLLAAVFLFTSCGASGADSDSGEPRKVTVITELNIEDESASDESADEMEEANIFSELIREDGTVDVTKVPHLYFYPLINDYRAFDPEVVSGARITVNNSNNLTPAESSARYWKSSMRPGLCWSALPIFS